MNKDNNIEKEELLEVVNHINTSSSQGTLITKEDLLEEPFSFTQEKADNTIEQLKNAEEYPEIKFLKGSSNTYIYSTEKMTDNYAILAMRIEDKDMVRTIVETVRDESKTYPRPTDSQLFLNRPFNFNKEEFLNALKKIFNDSNYNDIKKTQASNGAIYLYSDEFLHKDSAQSLTEWIEVLQFQNP